MAFRTLVNGFSYPATDAECKKAKKGEPCKRLEVPDAGTIIRSLPDIAAKSGLAQGFIEVIGEAELVAEAEDELVEAVA